MPSGRFEFYQLRCFVAVAEERNFRRAALRMNMTQPPLSRQIRQLEEALGVALFDRNNRSVQLTSAGESFLLSATELLERAEMAMLRARHAQRGEAGDVELAFVPSAGLLFIPQILRLAATRLPGVKIRPGEMMGYEIIEALSSGRLDFGLTRQPHRRHGLEMVRVVSEPFVLAVPADHPLAVAAAPQLSDLVDEKLVFYSADRGGHIRDMHTGLFASAGITPRIVQEVSQTHSVLALVDAGIGCALVPASAQAMKMENLTYRQIDLPPQFRSELFLAYGKKRRGTVHEAVTAVVVAALAVHNEYGGTA